MSLRNLSFRFINVLKKNFLLLACFLFFQKIIFDQGLRPFIFSKDSLDDYGSISAPFHLSHILLANKMQQNQTPKQNESTTAFPKLKTKIALQKTQSLSGRKERHRNQNSQFCQEIAQVKFSFIQIRSKLLFRLSQIHLWRQDGD